MHCVFHGIRFKVNNEDWLSVRMAFFVYGVYNIPGVLLLLWRYGFAGYPQKI